MEVRIAGMPHDPMQEINSSAFLIALLGGAPATERAFRYMVLHLRAPLGRYVGRWLREPEAIEDVLQETFLAVHRSLPRFEGKSRLTTWVYSLAHHKVMNRLAEFYRPDGRDSTEDECMEPVDSGLLPDETAHMRLLIARITAVAEEIPELYRDAWKLVDLEGMSGKGAAEALGITPALLRVRLHRARVMITDRLRQEQPELVDELVEATETDLRQEAPALFP